MAKTPKPASGGVRLRARRGGSITLDKNGKVIEREGPKLAAYEAELDEQKEAGDVSADN